MEKKYLELITRGKLIGAFEDVKVFEDRGDQGLYVESADGTFTLPVSEMGQGWKFREAGIYFNEYKLCGRRSLRNHTNDLQNVKKVQLK